MSWTRPGELITYASPLVITSKGDDDVRITADFRMANKGTSRTRIVPPGLRVDELSATFGNCKVFSHLIMKVDDESKKYISCGNHALGEFETRDACTRMDNQSG